MKKHVLCVLICLLAGGCASLKPDIYEDRLVFDQQYGNFDKKGVIYIKTIDGKIREFERLKIIEVTDTHFTAQGWIRGATEPEQLTYRLSDTVIEVKEVSNVKIISFFITIGLIVFLILVSENNRVTN